MATEIVESSMVLKKLSQNRATLIG
jgi:hypothetical protein